MPAWADDEYLHELGRVIYAVAALEGLMVSDLPYSSNPPSRAEFKPIRTPHYEAGRRGSARTCSGH